MIPATHLLLVMLGLAMLFGALLPNSNWRAALVALSRFPGFGFRFSV